MSGCSGFSSSFEAFLARKEREALDRMVAARRADGRQVKRNCEPVPVARVVAMLPEIVVKRSLEGGSATSMSHKPHWWEDKD